MFNVDFSKSSFLMNFGKIDIFQIDVEIKTFKLLKFRKTERKVY